LDQNIAAKPLLLHDVAFEPPHNVAQDIAKQNIDAHVAAKTMPDTMRRNVARKHCSETLLQYVRPHRCLTRCMKTLLRNVALIHCFKTLAQHVVLKLWKNRARNLQEICLVNIATMYCPETLLLTQIAFHSEIRLRLF
jgi:hypothetical protein